jgi:uncharacterized protein
MPETSSQTYALVTGAASGLGAAFLAELARRGFHIIGVSRPGDDVKSVVNALAARHGVEGIGMDLDLSQPGCATELRNQLKATGVQIEILINNVGIGGTSEFIESDHAYNRLMMELNMRTTVEMCREFAPEMVVNRRGCIVNVSSMAANFPMPYKSIYTASKAFVKSFSIGLRSEMKPFGVNVSVVQPGAMLTNPVVVEQLRHGSAMSRVSAMRPGDVAAFALDKAFKGKAVIIPGFKNWLTLGILRVFPRPLKTTLAVYNHLKTQRKSKLKK